jgi:hypothetical protein
MQILVSHPFSLLDEKMEEEGSCGLNGREKCNRVPPYCPSFLEREI